MNMFAGMLSGMFNKEKETHDVIQETLKDVAEELNCNRKEFFITITACDDNFEPKLFIYKTVDGKPKAIREITLKEILGDE